MLRSSRCESGALIRAVDYPVMGAAFRFERAQGPLARERGNLKLAKDELVKINRDRLRRCVSDRVTEFDDREIAQDAPAASAATARLEHRSVDGATAADRRRTPMRRRTGSTGTRLKRKKIN